MQRAKTRQYDRLLALLLGRKQVEGMTWDDVAYNTGTPKRRLQQRMTAPETLRLGELYAMADALGIPHNALWDALKEV